ncbi:MAG: pyrroline-5-carboxylate reductase [Bacteroidota bacterium]
MKTLLIGAGNMGLTFARSFIKSKVLDRKDLMILEKNNPDKIQELQKLKLGEVFIDPSCITDSQIIIFAVKPQDSETLFKEISGLVGKNHILVSIMAGVKMSTILDQFITDKVIRAMPNLPSQIGMGMTTFVSSDLVSIRELRFVQRLLNTTGRALYLENEGLIDSATAISGSGPAYIFFFIQSLIKASMEFGFSKADAELLVIQTFMGALNLYLQSDDELETLIKRVSSKGGTTEAAIKYFENSKLKKNIIEGAKQALNRAKELGG